MPLDHFKILGISPAFDLDLPALETAYFQAQRESHPDRFAAKPPAERQQALQRSVDINHAYENLKNPLKRARYLLHLQGITVGTEHDSVRPSKELLMEMMEWRERIAESPDVAVIADDLQKLHDTVLGNLSRRYLHAKWDDMAQETLRLGYVIKAQEEIMQKKRIKKA